MEKKPWFRLGVNVFETEEETDDTEDTAPGVTSKSLAEAGALYIDPATGRATPYVTSPELYQQMQKEGQRQAVIGGAAALAAETAQFGLGLSAFLDPAVDYSRRRLAQLRALEGKPTPKTPEGEKAAIRAAAVAPVMTQQTDIRQRAEKVIASRGGRATVRELTQAQEAGLGEVRKAAIGAEAAILSEDERRALEHEKEVKEARKEADTIEHMMFRMRQEYIREPIAKFLGNAMKVFGKAYAYAPAPSVEGIVEEMKTKGMSEEDIAKVLKTARGPRHASRMKEQLKAQAKERSKVETPSEKQPTEKKVDEKAEIKYPEGVQVQDDGYVRLPGDTAYEFKFVPDETGGKWTARKIETKEITTSNEAHGTWMGRFTNKPEFRTLFAAIKDAHKTTETPAE